MERNERIHKLDLEIESRISQFWLNLYPLINKNQHPFVFKQEISLDNAKDTIRFFWNVFKSAPNNTKFSYSIYQEYESRNIISLMAELWRLLEEKYKIDNEFADDVVNRDTNKSIVLKPIPKNKINSYEQILNIKSTVIYISTDEIFNEDSPISIEKIRKNFSDHIIYNRWGMFFAYTDGLFN